MNKMGGSKKQRGNRGRPPTRPAVLKDGFYFEVRNRSTDPTGVKIWKGTYEEMLDGVAQYSKTKTVIILGAYKNGKPVEHKIARRKKAA